MNIALLTARQNHLEFPFNVGPRSTRRLAVSWLVLCTLLLSGCSRLDTTYGKSDGAKGKQSLNGFGALRESLTRELDPTERSKLGDAWQDAELRARNLTRLSSRANQHDAIVWIPTAWPPANPAEVTDWMTKWLRNGNRTIVYVVPDEGSTEAYWREASQVAPPAQRLEYRRRLAQQINLRLLQDARREDVTVGKLFTARGLPARQTIDDRRIASYDLHPFDPARKPVVTTLTPIGQPTATVADDDANEEESAGVPAELIETEPSESELDQLFSDEDSADGDEATDAPQAPDKQAADQQFTVQQAEEDDPTDSTENDRPSLLFEPLDKAEDVTILARITHPKWKDSRILVVAGGGLLTNFAMTDQPALEMADRLRNEILATAKVGPDERVSLGFLSTDDMWVPISDAEPGAPSQTGMELLTTWPISLITIHALFLGVVMCLMLLPTFGRARQVVYHRSTHFGNHLTAMAVLMRRAGGMDFAKEKINHYMRVVRGEPDLFVVASPPPAAVPETPSPDPPKSTDQSPPDTSPESDLTEAEALATPVAPSPDPPSPHEPVEKSP
ncbi:putative transmembrane protein [Rhodopirellula islandica]|uniref:Transmembrane protein n=1 Tax=Rhodopirellula islandica TaxID=595434 RepID=A0A0J1BC62_RHOIS|nr:hypothetical protein [Rhodopirellula islandica]KLU04101.1 putative transmembrane protein [Rhodopirellula islandica]